MIIDAAREPLPSSTDILIIGSGAVGLPMAIELARAGLQVMLVEAGGNVPSDASQQYFNTAENVGANLQGLYTGRFRCLGGTTNFWGGQLARFDSCVFEKRTWIAEQGWPISRQSLEPYYDAALTLLGMNQCIREDGDVWKRLGVDDFEDNQEIALFLTRWAPTRNFMLHFGAELRKSPNLIVAVNCPAVAFFRHSGGEIAGVTFRGRDGADHQIESRDMVLANGTIEISRLLQMRLADGTAAPWSGNAWIGRGFMDHLECSAGLVRPINKNRFHSTFDNALIAGVKYSPKIKLTCKAQRTGAYPAMAAHFMFNSSVSEHLEYAKIFFRSLLRGRYERSAIGNAELLKGVRFALPMIARYVRHRRIYNLSDLGIQLRLVSEQPPRFESRIRLAEGRDDMGLPTAQVDWRVEPSELTGLGAFALMVQSYLLQNRLAEVDLNPALVAADSSFLNELQDTNHQMGGARMSTGRDHGVVDENCAIFEAKNVHVAGAAVFPTSGFANPTLTAIALGLRLCAALKMKRGLA